MILAKVRYKTTDGGYVEVEYDREANCIICGLPVVYASMGGTNVCSWCDCGRCGPDKATRLRMIMYEVSKEVKENK